MVIIDTLQKMLDIQDMNDYSQTVKGISLLKDIADTLGIAVVVIHHTRRARTGTATTWKAH
ncbi:AAA family ATPase [Treponema endosymbiont of Eucomonympha sp.]|uniref:AAA family ATPase n=1 Tax=Treponema endosymbiont of Eucomonympha sp. TaxID=1580831 RepID=UPI000781784E|nr:AAA family ATPase [Treponema endosymbiont of Eucomonympha sp.]